MKKTNHLEKNLETFQKIIDEKKVEIETLHNQLEETIIKLKEPKTESEKLMYENKYESLKDEIASAEFQIQASKIMQNLIKDIKEEK